ncbi:MAG TPA: hypothetical protein GXX28_08115 [Firmicutes bacterium]|nr:hypothetical protein [Bacillota bacterium]
MVNVMVTPNPKIREQDPITIQKTKEAAYVVKIISEAQIAARKCQFYAGIATDKEVADFFNRQADELTKGTRILQDYYESLTME